ncbi:MAG: NTP transferase domain-containing protein [Oscillospiraceae bacterium]|jgi:bifunctional UDP-N-acetylglucosamine pyrophosphorylase/glucosamine-1-phosphate N-acetyltransferase|nr:NTP transferase domain-containing protein [Oscillospiraceae bacterium]
MGNNAAIILAAGDGKRMGTDLPKVLLEVGGKAMLGWVLDAATGAGIANIGVVVGNNSDTVAAYLAARDVSYRTFMQYERKGTGHAVMQALPILNGISDVLVLCGDAPMLDSKTISGAYEYHRANRLKATVITATVAKPHGYGRIVRDEGGHLLKIAETKDCTPEELLITEVNSGAYWFDSAALKTALPLIGNNNKSGEYYLPDAVELIRKTRIGNGETDSYACAYNAASEYIVLGANDPEQLAALDNLMKTLHHD